MLEYQWRTCSFNFLYYLSKRIVQERYTVLTLPNQRLVDISSANLRGQTWEKPKRGEKWVYLGDTVIIAILRRQISRTCDSSIKQSRGCFASVSNHVLKNRACPGRFTPNCDFARITAEFTYLVDLRSALHNRENVRCTCFCTHWNANCWSTEYSHSLEWKTQMHHKKNLRKAAFSAPPFFRLFPGRNPNNPRRYWIKTVTTSPPDARIRSFPS